MRTNLLSEQWHLDPLICMLIMGSIYLYYRATGFKKTSSTLFYLFALALFVVCECSPLHQPGPYYFTKHMITHVVELLICGPLLVISLETQTFRPVHHSLISTLSALFWKHSWTAWLFGIGIMWFWHVPAVFNRAMSAMHESFSIIPVLHGGSMIVAGMFFSWPIFGPVKSARLQPLTGMVYLFMACVSCSLLGLLITFAPLKALHYYMAMETPSGSLRDFSAAEDQRIAGLIMWVPCCFIYLSGCLYLLYRWFAESDFPEKAAVTSHISNN